MSADEYWKLPESIMVRELRYRITAPGFRTREVTLVTTLLDARRTRLMRWRNFMGRGGG